jgi:hypothetical protein
MRTINFLNWRSDMDLWFFDQISEQTEPTLQTGFMVNMLCYIVNGDQLFVPRKLYHCIVLLLVLKYIKIKIKPIPFLMVIP